MAVVIREDLLPKIGDPGRIVDGVGELVEDATVRFGGRIGTLASARVAEEVLEHLQAAGWRPSPPASERAMTDPDATRSSTALDDLAAIVVSEVDALIEDAGDRREPGTVRVLETLRAAVRYLERRPVVESLDDAVRVVEDPVLIQHADGTVTSSWPNDTAIAALVSREALDSFVASYSALGKTVEAIRRQVSP